MSRSVPMAGSRSRARRHGGDAFARATAIAYTTTAVADVSFACCHCGLQIPAAAVGTGHRNHCPHCLWSLHVDVRPGDRANLCRAPMEPVALWVLPDGEQRLIHRCTRCNSLRANRIAGDDSDDALVRLAGAPVRARS